MVKTKDLVDRSREELEELYVNLCRDIFELMNELKVSRKLDKPHLLRMKKRDRARVLTLLHQSEQKIKKTST